MEEKFTILHEIAFAGLSVMTVLNWYASVTFSKRKTFSDKDSMKQLLDLQLWYLFKYGELTEVVRKYDKLFMDLLYKVWVGNIDDDVGYLLYARFITEYDENYAKDALHI